MGQLELVGPIGDPYERREQQRAELAHQLGTDQVTRAQRIMAANPGLMITRPKQNGTPHFIADWTGENEVIGRAHHDELRVLLDELTGKYGFKDA